MAAWIRPYQKLLKSYNLKGLWVLLTAPAALLISVNFNLIDATSAQDNLSKLLTALSA